MIDTIIFDFGDIFINLDKTGTPNALRKLGLNEWNEELNQLNFQFEKGQISRKDFLIGLQNQVPNANPVEVLKAWNAVLLDFPEYRLAFLKTLKSKYRLFLLSNTDSIHIETFRTNHGESFYQEFYQCFEKVYYSFEMGMRKPDTEIYACLINKHNLVPQKTLFVDDKKENTDAANSLGIQVWNLQVGQEDVINLFEKNIL